MKALIPKDFNLAVQEGRQASTPVQPEDRLKVYEKPIFVLFQFLNWLVHLIVSLSTIKSWIDIENDNAS